MSARKPLIAANWKMYKTPKEAHAFTTAFLPLVANAGSVEIALFPPSLAIAVTVESVRGTRVHIGSQNLFWQDEGAFTGEISAPMIRAAGCTHVLIGHSERRQFFGETDETVNRKLHAALKHSLTPVVCVGELLSEREAGQTEDVLRRQTSRALEGISPEMVAPIAIAYEPVWAIGTGRTATPEIAAEAHVVIRSQVAHALGRHAAENMRILYGGSVKPDNAPSLMNQPEIDGALVGGASLDPHSFAKIVESTGA